MKHLFLLLLTTFMFGCAQYGEKHDNHDHSGKTCSHSEKGHTCDHKADGHKCEHGKDGHKCDPKVCKGKEHTCSHSEAKSCDHKDGMKCEHKCHDGKKCGHSCGKGEHSCDSKTCKDKGHSCKHGDHRTGHHEHDFSDAKLWAKKFNDPQRDSWQKPSEVVSKMKIVKGENVADIGAGTGYMLPHLAQAAPDGIVFGLDVEVSLVEYMNEYIQKKSLKNAEARLIELDNPKLGNLEVEKVLIVNTWHHIENRKAYAKKLHSQLPEEGQVFLVEFNHEKSDFGPPLAMRLKPSQVKAELGSAGFSCSTLSESLPRQYMVKCSK